MKKITVKLGISICLVLFVFITPAYSQGEYGAIVDIPVIENLPDYDYPNYIPILWRGGEEKFGQWRQFHNGFEMGWGLAYNTKWNYQNNSWNGRDSGDLRASICAMIRFNVAEGDSGRNVFEINFAKPGEEGTPPDWNSASHYFFYDGNTETKAPAMMQIHGPGGVDTMIQLAPDEGGLPDRINLRNACNGKLYIEREVIGSVELAPTYSSITIPLMVFNKEKGLVGIGHDNPISALDAKGGLTLRGIETAPVEIVDNAMSLWMDSTTGNIMMRVVHNGQVRQGAVILFENLKQIN